MLKEAAGCYNNGTDGTIESGNAGGRIDEGELETAEQ